MLRMDRTGLSDLVLLPLIGSGKGDKPQPVGGRVGEGGFCPGAG